MKIIGITPPDARENETTLIEAMLDRGVYRFHIRKPNWTPKKMVPFLESFNPQYRKSLILHDLKQWPFTELFGGVHLKGYMSDFSIKKSVDSLSRSCHSLEEIKKFGHNFEYMFLSPIFDSISKRGYTAAFDHALLKSADLTKVFALGGVDVENIPVVRELGFGGAAVLGAVWQSESPLARMEQILEAARE